MRYFHFIALFAFWQKVLIFFLKALDEKPKLTVYYNHWFKYLN